MPYCPQCGAEYTDLVSNCHECGVALVAQRPEIGAREKPPAAGDSLARPVFPPFFARVRRDLSAAWGYGKEAYDLLRRHPSLVLIPIALALFNATENEIGRYLATAHTAFGRAALARAHAGAGATRDERSFTFDSWGSAYGTARRLAFPSGANRLVLRSFRPDLSGTATFLGQASAPPGGPLLTPQLLAVMSAVALVGLLVGTLFVAGYLGRLRRTVDGEEVAGAFWKDARAYCWPLVVYFIVAGVIALTQLMTYLRTWVGPLLLLFTCLTPVGIVRDRAFWQAFRESCRLVWSHYLTALALAVGASVACFLILLPYYYVHYLLRAQFILLRPGVILLDAARDALLALIAVWATLALFVWYREATAVTPAADDAAPAEA